MTSLAAVIVSAVILSGCSTTSTSAGRTTTGRESGERLRPPGEVQVKEVLYSQLRNWETVRYRHGGLSKKGVDCSGFVYLTFRDRFGIELPRSTKLQSRKGSRVSRRDLRPGDLVFFKTGFFSRHVGIYVENSRFLHVSRKRGVTISSLDGYWSKKYWQSRRM